MRGRVSELYPVKLTLEDAAALPAVRVVGDAGAVPSLPHPPPSNRFSRQTDGALP